MAWHETLVELREELAEVRADRKRQAAANEAELQEVRQAVSRLADSLGIISLLSEINSTLSLQRFSSGIAGFSRIGCLKVL